MSSSLAHCGEENAPLNLQALVTMKLSIQPEAGSFGIRVSGTGKERHNYLLNSFISRNRSRSVHPDLVSPVLYHMFIPKAKQQVKYLPLQLQSKCTLCKRKALEREPAAGVTDGTWGSKDPHIGKGKDAALNVLLPISLETVASYS